MDGSRADRRLPNAFRDVSIDAGISWMAHGSCLLRVGDTAVLVSVIGPREGKLRRTDTSLLQIRAKSYPERQDINEVVESVACAAIERSAYPDAAVEIAVAILNDDGGLLACCANATNLALVDAGVKMVSEVGAAAVVIAAGAALWLDPTLREESLGAVVTVAWRKRDGAQVGVWCLGPARPDLVVYATSTRALHPLFA